MCPIKKWKMAVYFHMSSRKRTRKPKARNFTDDEVAQLRKGFDQMDKDHSGFLDEEEIKSFLEEVGMEPEYARLIMRVFDVNKDGQISFDEFREFMKAMAQLERDPKKLYRMLFDAIDEDNNGSIDVEEMVEFAKCLGVELSGAEAEAAFKEIDKRSNGLIDFDELCRALEL